MIIGENGAGKSTLLKLIMGLIYPTSGIVFTSGLKIGYVPEKVTIPKLISIEKFLLTLCELKKGKKEDIDYYLSYWGLEKDKQKKIGELSKGMMQKVIITQAFFGSPDIMIFDEALNGLDSTMQKKLLELIKNKKKEGKIILITSHYKDYYNEIVDKTLVIRNKTLWEN